MRILSALLLSNLGVAAIAQPAAFEVNGVFGECAPVYAAEANRILLYQKPDLDSPQFELPYREGWRIPAPKQKGLTRVLSVGTLRVTEPDPDMSCRVKPVVGKLGLVEGELVDYLYYLGEGFGAIRFRGAQCEAEVDTGLNHFEQVRPPKVQVWLKVFFEDGSSPGWLLHDGTQTRVVKIQC